MFSVLDLFSGIGGFSLGLERTGHFRTDLFCEAASFPASVLRKHWPSVPIHGDVATLTRETLLSHGVEPDIVCGGFPCQDISMAGRGKGLTGDRSALWFEMLRIIDETKPKYAIIENVSALRSRGLGVILRGLTSIGYDAEWHCVPAAAVGAPHRRDRIWILAYPAGERREIRAGEPRGEPCEARRLEPSGLGQTVADTDCPRRSQPSGRVEILRGWPVDCREVVADRDQPGLPFAWHTRESPPILSIADIRRAADRGYWRRLEPGMGGTADGLPARAHRYPVAVEPWEGDTPRTVGRGYPDRRQRLMSLGNSIVPQIAEMIGWAIVRKEIET